jgi:hypothetical protein
MLTIGRTSLVLIGAGVIVGFLIGKYTPWPNGNPEEPLTNLAQGAGGKSNQLNFQNAPVNTILDIYEQISGKHFIRDANLAGVPPISVNCGGLNKDEVVKLIAATLLLNGVAIIPVDDRTMKAITTGTNKNPRSEGLRTYTNAADLPVDAQIVSYCMPLTYINPQEAAGIFVQVAPTHAYGAYVPSPSAHAILLTEDVSVIRQLINLKKLIDVPPVTAPARQSPMPARNELVIVSILIIIAFATGNLFAYLWLRKKTVNGTR